MSESMLNTPKRWLDPSWQQALKTPLVIALAIALAVQLLIVVLADRGTSLAPSATDAALLAFDTAAVTAIEIRAGNGAGDGAGDGKASEPLTLARAGDGWTLPNLGDFPVSASRVDQLMDTLSSLTRPLPVATTEAARKRFKVADEAYGQRLTLRDKDGELASLLIGDSPGFRRSFVRVAGDDAVYDLRLAQSDVSANADDWIDRGRLQLDSADIARIASGDWTLVKDGEKDGGAWRLEGSEQLPDADAVDDLLRNIASLGYRGVLGTEDQPEFGLEAPLLSLELGLADGSSRGYRIGRLEGGEDYALKEASGAYYYRLAAFDVDGLLDLSTAKLLGQSPTQEEDESLGMGETEAVQPSAAEPAPASETVPEPAEPARPER